MKDFLLELKKEYPNDQDFGKIMRTILSDQDFLDLCETKIDEITDNPFLSTGLMKDPRKGCYYNKHNILTKKLKDKYLYE
jgi:hypothetical protein